MVLLVCHPCTHVQRSICIVVSLRTSTIVSSSFILFTISRLPVRLLHNSKGTMAKFSLSSTKNNWYGWHTMFPLLSLSILYEMIAINEKVFPSIRRQIRGIFGSGGFHLQIRQDRIRENGQKRETGPRFCPKVPYYSSGFQIIVFHHYIWAF